jgi:hypothetical protein
MASNVLPGPLFDHSRQAVGVTSGWVASKFADSIDDEIEEFTKWKIS